LPMSASPFSTASDNNDHFWILARDGYDAIQ